MYNWNANAKKIYNQLSSYVQDTVTYHAVHGGGVLIYGKEKWTVFNTHDHNNIKMLTLDIKQYISTKITVTVLFRKPDANAD